MLLKRRMPLAILALRAMPHAVSQNRLQLVEIRAHNIQPLIGHDSRKILPNPAPHHPRLSVMNLKSLFHQNRRSPQRESLHTSLKFLIA